MVRSIFESEAQALVNPVNCVGVMGRGLAKDFATIYPEMVQSYISVCRKGFNPGEVHTWKAESGKYIINFPTKVHWRDPSKLEYIIKGLEGLLETCKKMNIHSIAIPALGCGLGQLDWPTVKDLILKQFDGTGIVVDLYEPL
jgi:O-acetyl-ADP-ribose deacetylase (regulator of RNase III)